MLHVPTSLARLRALDARTTQVAFVMWSMRFRRRDVRGGGGQNMMGSRRVWYVGLLDATTVSPEYAGRCRLGCDERVKSRLSVRAGSLPAYDARVKLRMTSAQDNSSSTLHTLWRKTSSSSSGVPLKHYNHRRTPILLTSSIHNSRRNLFARLRLRHRLRVPNKKVVGRRGLLREGIGGNAK